LLTASPGSTTTIRSNGVNSPTVRLPDRRTSTSSTKQTTAPRGTRPTTARTARTDRTCLHLPGPRNLGTVPMRAVPPAALACVAVRPLAPYSPGDACAGIGAPVDWRHVAGGPANAHKKAPQAGGAGGARGTGLGEKSYVPDLLQGMGGDQRQTLHLSRAI